MKIHTLALISFGAAVMSVGCAATRDVEVNGEVTSTQAIGGPIALSFYELEDAAEAERMLIKTTEIEATGSFAETLAVAEDIVVVVALADQNGDGLCTDGELWGEAQQTVQDDDTVEDLVLELRADPCPIDE